MKKMRFYYLGILGFFVITFILGSIFDQQISGAIFSRGNTFGLVVAAVGTLPGYLLFSLIGGGFLSIAIKKTFKLPVTIIFYVLCVAFFGLNIFFAGREFFGANGFNNKDLVWVGYLIVLPFAGGVTYLGYRLFSKAESKYLWVALLIVSIAIFMALVPGVSLLKATFHRPRYRSVTLYDEITYHNWWQACKNYKELMSVTGLTSEEFKSFPSGHTGAAALTLLIPLLLQLVDKRFEKCSVPCVCTAFVWTIFVAFTRILVGAHFLSDVSMGAILTVLMVVCANECIIYANHKLENK